MKIGSHVLFGFQILAHVALALLFVYGDLKNWLVCLLIYFFTGAVGMSMTYHRLLSHRSWKSPRWLKLLGTFLGTIGLTGSALAWVAIHRQHHTSTDKIKDPHSPNIQPWWRVQFLSMYYKPNLRYVKDLLKDKQIVFLHKNYFLVQVLYFAFLWFAFEPFATVYAYLAPAAILWHGGSLINSVGHKWGYRNYKTNDLSVNNPILGIFMWGEGWHNNHHAKPFAKSFRRRFWEIDISAMLISLLEVKVKK